MKLLKDVRMRHISTLNEAEKAWVFLIYEITSIIKRGFIKKYKRKYIDNLSNNHMPNKVKKWEEISRETTFQKYSRSIEKVIYKMSDGKECDYYLKKEGPATGILALTKDQQVILVKQYRPGPNEILNELPGGYVGENENPEEAAERELLEETGYKGKMKLVATAFDCAYSTMNRYCIVATDCEKVAGQNLDKNEFAEVLLVPVNEFRKLIKNGKNTDVEVGYIGLDYLGLL